MNVAYRWFLGYPMNEQIPHFSTVSYIFKHRYTEKTIEEINEEQNDHGKKPFDGPKPPEEREISESTTDPEIGVFHKGEHKKCFAYIAQTGCDKNGYVMDVTVNPRNVQDGVTFDGLYDRLVEKNPEIKAAVADIN